MSNDIQNLLEIKKKQLQIAEKQVECLNADIAAIHRVVQIEREAYNKRHAISAEKKVNIGSRQDYKQRTEDVVKMLRENGESHVREISEVIGDIKEPTLRLWMVEQIEKWMKDDCPWTYGRNKSYFVLRPGYELPSSLYYNE